MGCLDSSTTRVAASRYQTGVVQLKNVKEWVSARADMNWNLWMAMLANEKKDADDNLVESIYWLLRLQMDKDRIREYWAKMTEKERCTAMEIAF